jgi:hypothetical protein
MHRVEQFLTDRSPPPNLGRVGAALDIEEKKLKMCFELPEIPDVLLRHRSNQHH